MESFSRALGISKIRALVTPFHPLQIRDIDGGNMKIIGISIRKVVTKVANAIFRTVGDLNRVVGFYWIVIGPSTW